MTSAWYVVQTASRAEKRVRDALREERFEVYLPLETRLSRHSRPRVRVESALLPGYLFVQLQHDSENAPKRLYTLRGVGGVLGLVGVKGKPIPVPVMWLASLRDSENAGLFDFTPRGRPNFEAKQRVTITSGPFRGLGAEVLRMDKPGRVQILMDALGGGTSRPCTISIDHLELVA